MMDGQEFREWRIRHDWSQRQAAAALQVDRRSVLEWEAGRSPIDVHIETECAVFDLLAHVEARVADGKSDELADVVLLHLAPARARAKAASQMPGRGRPALKRAVDMIDAGDLHSNTNGADDTAESRARLNRMIDD